MGRQRLSSAPQTPLPGRLRNRALLPQRTWAGSGSQGSPPAVQGSGAAS
eukprot:CAMPEP_0206376152 /NCGR_PEP_ID=MMETSP0294-20121207/9303_1 /ASSEMBLY_ACC=CAM_ASM_000327 /TAXON_ID=39354 /ORGANISM="Heterosigma akashiwo, Strain CCMP2393" /LENGTH=48 /DNA_ID= /DNA_START= /DNA_END= /DNA_ORIENTATION=